jgi:hypothetical protein
MAEFSGLWSVRTCEQCKMLVSFSEYARIHIVSLSHRCIYTYKYRQLHYQQYMHITVYAYMHIYIYAYIYIYIYTYIYTHKYLHDPLCTVYAYMYVYVQTCSQARMGLSVRLLTHIPYPTQHTCIHIQVLPYHTQHTYIHTHTGAPYSILCHMQLVCMHTWMQAYIQILEILPTVSVLFY